MISSLLALSLLLGDLPTRPTTAPAIKIIANPKPTTLPAKPPPLKHFHTIIDGYVLTITEYATEPLPFRQVRVWVRPGERDPGSKRMLARYRQTTKFAGIIGVCDFTEDGKRLGYWAWYDPSKRTGPASF